MGVNDDALFRRFSAACSGFGDRLRAVRADQWAALTPCPEWDVRRLVGHMARGNLNYVLLVRGGSGEAFLRLRDEEALGDDPVGAFERSVAECLRAFREPGALDRITDYPMGAIPGRQLLAVRLTDSVVHTWDLARATGLDEELDPDLVTWILDEIEWVYRGIAHSPVSPTTDHRFFAAPGGAAPSAAQDRLLHLMGRLRPAE